MARLKLLQPYEMRPVGAVIELPGGIASVLVLRKVGVVTTEPVSDVTAEGFIVASSSCGMATGAPKADKPKKPKADKPKK